MDMETGWIRICECLCGGQTTQKMGIDPANASLINFIIEIRIWNDFISLFFVFFFLLFWGLLIENYFRKSHKESNGLSDYLIWEMPLLIFLLQIHLLVFIFSLFHFLSFSLFLSLFDDFSLIDFCFLFCFSFVFCVQLWRGCLCRYISITRHLRIYGFLWYLHGVLRAFLLRRDLNRSSLLLCDSTLLFWEIFFCYFFSKCERHFLMYNFVSVIRSLTLR